MSSSTAPDPPFQNLARHANKIMDQLQKGYYNFCPSETWTPSVNLYETAREYLVCVDLSGVEKAKIDLEVVDGHLKLRGSRPVPTFVQDEGQEQPTQEAAAPPARKPAPHAEGAEPQEPRMRVHLMEIDHGSFAREVELPLDVDREKISATYRNGMLWVEIPKR